MKSVSSANTGKATRQHATSRARFQGGRDGWASGGIARREGGGGRGAGPGGSSQVRIGGGRRQRGHEVSVEGGRGAVHGRGRGKTHIERAWHCVGRGRRAGGIFPSAGNENDLLCGTARRREAVARGRGRLRQLDGVWLRSEREHTTDGIGWFDVAGARRPGDLQSVPSAAEGSCRGRNWILSVTAGATRPSYTKPCGFVMGAVASTSARCSRGAPPRTAGT